MHPWTLHDGLPTNCPKVHPPCCCPGERKKKNLKQNCNTTILTIRLSKKIQQMHPTTVAEYQNGMVITKQEIGITEAIFFIKIKLSLNYF